MIDIIPASLEEALVTCGRGQVAQQRVRLVSSPLLAALRRTGTAHVYADTADSEELRRLLAVAGGGILAEVDGNTINQPLARQVLDRSIKALPEYHGKFDGVAIRAPVPVGSIADIVCLGRGGGLPLTRSTASFARRQGARVTSTSWACPKRQSSRRTFREVRLQIDFKYSIRSPFCFSDRPSLRNRS